MRRKSILLTCLAALFAFGLVQGLTTTSPGSTAEAAALASTMTSGDCQNHTYNRDCPNMASYCASGGLSCSWLISLSDLTNNCTNSTYGSHYQVHVEVLSECDTNVYDYQAAFYNGGHFIGGGSFPGGSDEYFCYAAKPDYLYLTWRGDPPSSLTKGPSSVRVTICCSDCTVE